jgi:hypothetical protein
VLERRSRQPVAGEQHFEVVARCAQDDADHRVGSRIGHGFRPRV